MSIRTIKPSKLCHYLRNSGVGYPMQEDPSLFRGLNIRYKSNDRIVKYDNLIKPFFRMVLKTEDLCCSVQEGMQVGVNTTTWLNNREFDREMVSRGFPEFFQEPYYSGGPYSSIVPVKKIQPLYCNPEKEIESVGQELQRRKAPQLYLEFLGDSTENIDKFFYSLGIAAYCHRDNKNFSEEIKQIFEAQRQAHIAYQKEKKSKVEKNKVSWEVEKKRREQYGVVSNLQIRRVLNFALANTDFHREGHSTRLYDEDIRRETAGQATRLIKRIRMSYPQKGDEVRTGLLELKDYDQLHNYLTELTKGTFDREGLLYNINRGFAILLSSLCCTDGWWNPPHLIMPGWPRMDNELAMKIGMRRNDQFLKGEVVPYKKEQNLINRYILMRLRRLHAHRTLEAAVIQSYGNLN